MTNYTARILCLSAYQDQLPHTRTEDLQLFIENSVAPNPCPMQDLKPPAAGYDCPCGHCLGVTHIFA